MPKYLEFFFGFPYLIIFLTFALIPQEQFDIFILFFICIDIFIAFIVCEAKDSFPFLFCFFTKYPL